MTWKPIETAPKDGTEVILLLPLDDAEVAIQGSWGKYPDCGTEDYGWEFARLNSHGCGCCSSQDEMPTHWMPLPEPTR